MRGKQALPALIGRDGELRVGVRGGEIRLRLRVLLVNLRGVDLGEELALLHRRANVGIPDPRRLDCDRV